MVSTEALEGGIGLSFQLSLKCNLCAALSNHENFFCCKKGMCGCIFLQDKRVFLRAFPDCLVRRNKAVKSMQTISLFCCCIKDGVYLWQTLKELVKKIQQFSTMIRTAVCCLSLLFNDVERLVRSLDVLSELILLISGKWFCKTFIQGWLSSGNIALP